MPIFKSTSQAVWFAYMIEQYPDCPESQMAKLMRQARQELGDIWGHNRSTVDFGGLTAQEIRGQCAMIRAAVEDRLPAPEMHCLRAKYIPHGRITKEGEKPRIQFDQRKTESVEYLAEWQRARFDYKKDAMELLVARHFSGAPSLQVIVDLSGMSMGKVHKDGKTLAKALWELEGRALDNLVPAFEAEDVV